MKKIFFIFVGIFILCSAFVQGATDIIQAGNIIIKPDLFSSIKDSSTPFVANLNCDEDLGEEGCRGDGECFKVGTRKIIDYPENILDWVWRGNIEPQFIIPSYHLKNIKLDKIYLYCDKNYDQFSFQKITGEKCEYDFECESNVCNTGTCEQKSNIDITRVYNDGITSITKLFFPKDQIFYFQGLDKTYFIGFGKNNNSEFISFVNLHQIPFENKTLIIDNKTQFIFDSINFNNGTITASVTLIESKNPIDDSEELLKSLFEEKEIVEIPEISKEYPAPITGNIIGTKENNFVNKILNFFKNLFGQE